MKNTKCTTLKKPPGLAVEIDPKGFTQAHVFKLLSHLNEQKIVPDTHFAISVYFIKNALQSIFPMDWIWIGDSLSKPNVILFLRKCDFSSLIDAYLQGRDLL